MLKQCGQSSQLHNQGSTIALGSVLAKGLTTPITAQVNLHLSKHASSQLKPLGYIWGPYYQVCVQIYIYI